MDLGREPIVATPIPEDRVDDEALDRYEDDPAHGENHVVEPEDLLGLAGVRLGRDHAARGEEGEQHEQGSGAKEGPNPRSGHRS